MSPSSSILTPPRRPLSSQIGLAHALIAPHLILSMPLSLSPSSSSFTSCSSSTPSSQTLYHHTLLDALDSTPHQMCRIYTVNPCTIFIIISYTYPYSAYTYVGASQLGKSCLLGCQSVCILLSYYFPYPAFSLLYFYLQ